MEATQLPPAHKPKSPIVIPDRVMERAATRYVLDPVTGCHVSTYSVASHGYAQIGWQDKKRGRVTTAHRAAWAHTYGQIPEGMTIDHLCKNRQCVNIEHLRLNQARRAS